MNNNLQFNLLFYSQLCPTCRDLLMLLKNENLISNFKLICVDDKLDRLPPDMRVPTMSIVGLSRPLVVHEAFEWVKQVKFIRQQNAMRHVNQQQHNNVQNTTRNGAHGFMAYDSDIFGGISDKFASTETDNPLPHSFFGVGDEEKNAIFTAPKDESINSSEQMQRMRELENKRTTQDNNFGELMKYEQMNAVMNGNTRGN